MGRKPKGKALTLRPIRLDDDVWAECQRLGKEHGTINEGLRQRLVRPDAVRINISELSDVPTYTGYEGHPLKDPNYKRPFKGPLLKPSEKKK